MEDVPKSELAWTMQDYQAMGDEAPDRLMELPESCEGELMTDEEVQEFIRDSVATIMILADHGSDRTEMMLDTFIADLDFLMAIGRISEDEYNELSNTENYSF